MSSRAAPGAIVGGRYRVIDLLGEGTFGAVYQVERLADGAALAMKILKEEACADGASRARLRREASALSTLAHPNVVSVVELGEDGDRTFLVTELLVGTTLEALLEAAPPEPAATLRIVDQILAGLAFAHAMGVAHRDIKPANVFLVEGPEGPLVKLLDFGLAKFHEPGAWGHHTVLTASGTVLGTPQYMAPEQIFGPSVDARADVYGAGVVLFELLAGRLPFPYEAMPELFRAHVAEPPPALAAACPERTFVPELEALVARALAKRAEDRFSDARAMRTALSRLPKDPVRASRP